MRQGGFLQSSVQPKFYLALIPEVLGMTVNQAVLMYRLYIKHGQFIGFDELLSL